MPHSVECISVGCCALWASRCGPASLSRQAAAWHRDAGGGEQAALGDCLLAALDSADRAPGAEHRLRAILEEARRTDHAAVEVFALDALARCAADAGDLVTAADLCAGADRRMELASHVITDRDRTDAAWVRQRV